MSVAMLAYEKITESSSQFQQYSVQLLHTHMSKIRSCTLGSSNNADPVVQCSNLRYILTQLLLCLKFVNHILECVELNYYMLLAIKKTYQFIVILVHLLYKKFKQFNYGLLVSPKIRCDCERTPTAQVFTVVSPWEMYS